MSADGSGLRVLSPGGFQGQPSFSPDGKWIVYERDIAEGNNGVWLMGANGTNLRRVTRSPFGCCDTDPNFSPDRKTISFVRVKEHHKLQAIFSVRRDGSRLRQLTPYAWEVGVKHDWSPDGKVILLPRTLTSPPGESANLVTIRPDGSGMTNLTRFTRGKNAFAGSFSPDGKQIVFRHETGNRYSLAIINRDGSNLRRLTTSREQPRYIDWGTPPSGQHRQWGPRSPISETRCAPVNRVWTAQLTRSTAPDQLREVRPHVATANPRIKRPRGAPRRVARPTGSVPPRGDPRYAASSC